jgi:hypothetical protein
MRFITIAALNKDAAIVAVGGGESRLVDDLLASVYCNLTVLDISSTALEATLGRLHAGGVGEVDRRRHSRSRAPSRRVSGVA